MIFNLFFKMVLSHRITLGKISQRKQYPGYMQVLITPSQTFSSLTEVRIEPKYVQLY
jgi:hypothetical protein